jgi:hypothetical protein
MRRDDASSCGFVIWGCYEGARATIWNTNEREITSMVMLSLLLDVYGNMIFCQGKEMWFY